VWLAAAWARWWESGLALGMTGSEIEAMLRDQCGSDTWSIRFLIQWRKSGPDQRNSLR
jgi:hypothetical protein